MLDDSTGQILRTTTDATGGYRFDRLANGNYVVHLLIGGSAGSKVVTISDPTGVEITADLQYSAVARITGRLLTVLGSPVADGQVALLSNGAVVATSLVDATGAYGFLVASPGTYDLRAAAPDANFEPVSGLAVNPGDSPSLDFVAGDATLQVTVTDDIQPVTGALVMLFLQQGGEVVPAGFAELEAGAVVTFANLLPGNYKIDVTNSPGREGSATVSLAAARQHFRVC